jgi:hypothetical protein
MAYNRYIAEKTAPPDMIPIGMAINKRQFPRPNHWKELGSCGWVDERIKNYRAPLPKNENSSNIGIRKFLLKNKNIGV